MMRKNHSKVEVLDDNEKVSVTINMNDAFTKTEETPTIY